MWSGSRTCVALWRLSRSGPTGPRTQSSFILFIFYVLTHPLNQSKASVLLFVRLNSAYSKLASAWREGRWDKVKEYRQQAEGATSQPRVVVAESNCASGCLQPQVILNPLPWPDGFSGPEHPQRSMWADQNLRWIVRLCPCGERDEKLPACCGVRCLFPERRPKSVYARQVATPLHNFSLACEHASRVLWERQIYQIRIMDPYRQVCGW
jgi:hypothetical protein